MALAIAWLVVGLLGVFVVALIGGSTGAPPDLVASEPQPLEDDRYDLRGDAPYVLVASAAVEAEPVCSIVGPGGEEVESEVAPNWARSDRPAIARFYAQDTGNHEITCSSDGVDLEVAVAEDGAREWDEERDAHEHRMIAAVVLVAVVGVALLLVGTRRVVRSRT
ncbi:hypothetical protein [Georgenia sp. Z1491]|uniref:hypothetical protein n=1 Tax=Georgenia sp. Z1491 TaxID=3416707 RepID=UPI003CEAEFE8